MLIAISWERNENVRILRIDRIREGRIKIEDWINRSKALRKWQKEKQYVIWIRKRKDKMECRKGYDFIAKRVIGRRSWKIWKKERSVAERKWKVKRRNSSYQKK